MGIEQGGWDGGLRLPWHWRRLLVWRVCLGWSHADQDLLLALEREGAALSDIMPTICRSRGAVLSRLKLLKAASTPDSGFLLITLGGHG
jgi:hypothetical protein